MARPRFRATSLARALLFFVALALTACSKDDGPSTPEPSSAFPGGTGALPTLPPPTGSSEATGSSGATGVPTGTSGFLPTTSPGAATGNLSDGQAAVTVSGDLRVSKVLPSLVSSVYAPPPGGMAVVWTAGGTDSTTLGIGGLSFTGTEPTAPTLSLTLTVQTPGAIASFLSTAGECDITIGAATGDQLAGAFTCSDLVGSNGETVDASGSFTAQG